MRLDDQTWLHRRVADHPAARAAVLRDRLLAIAVSSRGPVGVDLEPLNQCGHALPTATAFFAPHEASWLAAPDFSPLAATKPSWPPVVAVLNGAPYTVVWYTSIVDEALVIAARADVVPGRPIGSP
ncbi:hypothetical protein CU669_09090 [Paramagnetospirillum kuznetsovii]|uniref:Uncharacterized protein n=1 Tax=Paramagnetospirillum kuznetsovii TaxID=2053833 RepID=A0A364NYW1_9PROT|nr:hypothetical protein [Paramagnetospirillum kuznetsovii]RAU22268.1 hypothetical protein CU669_09090 [Paramagnetospirillum kuznetsovii]